MSKNKGFTFIELLVVITIIAVVFAAGIVSYTTISKNSRDARRRADVEAIRQALEMCRSITGDYPDTIYPDSGSVECDAKTPPTVTMKTTPHDPKTCDGDVAGLGEYLYEPEYAVDGVTVTGYTLTAICMENYVTPTYPVTNP